MKAKISLVAPSCTISCILSRILSVIFSERRFQDRDLRIFHWCRNILKIIKLFVGRSRMCISLPFFSLFSTPSLLPFHRPCARTLHLQRLLELYYIRVLWWPGHKAVFVAHHRIRYQRHAWISHLWGDSYLVFTTFRYFSLSSKIIRLTNDFMIAFIFLIELCIL